MNPVSFTVGFVVIILHNILDYTSRQKRHLSVIIRYFTRKDWTLVAVCAAFVVMQVYLDLLIPDYMTVITEAIATGEPPSVIYGYGGEMLLCAFLSIAVSFIASMAAARAAISLCRTLRLRLFDKVAEFSPEDVHRFSVDSLITRSTNDVTQVQNFVAQALSVVIKVPVLSVWAILKMAGAEWEWTAVTAAGVLFMVAFMAVIIWWTRPRYKLIPVLTDHINHYAQEHLTGIRVVRAYNAERFQEAKFAKASIDMMDNAVYIWNRASLTPAVSAGVSNLLTVAIYWTGVVLIAGTSATEHQTLLLSQMIVFSSYATLILNAFMRLAFLIQFSARALESSRRVQQLIEYEPTIEDGSFEGGSGGTVEFDHVTFSYPGSDSLVLEDVSFSVRGGQTVAVMGATGSGKSTLVKLIMRAYRATSGTIRVDGVDVNDYRQRCLNSKISYVPQTNVVFSGTVGENINYGDTSSQRTLGDVRRAERVAQASEFVDALPGREDYRTDEDGHNLSGGQRQRISIARAVCRDAELWILDDPFSALDFSTDRNLRAAMREECPGRTKIIVAQRVGTVMDADLIVVLDRGRVVGKGRHDELMETCQIYRDLAVSQMAEGTF